MSTRYLFLTAALLGAGCTTLTPSAIPASQPYVVAVLDVQMDPTMPWISHFAHHTWFEIKDGSENNWKIIEIVSADSGLVLQPINARDVRSNVRWTKPVSLLALYTSDRAKAMIPQLEAAARAYPNPLHYEAWPGPNSNTFAATMSCEVPGLAFVFDHNAAGKDYTPWLYLGPTASRTGFRVDTVPLGFALGIRDGVEVHLLQLTVGVSLFPPALKIPFLPRIGFSAQPNID